MLFKGNSKVNPILNLLFDYPCKLYFMSCYLKLPFCSVWFYSLFQEMSVVFQFMFPGPTGYGHVWARPGPARRAAGRGWKQFPVDFERKGEGMN